MQPLWQIVVALGVGSWSPYLVVCALFQHNVARIKLSQVAQIHALACRSYL